MNELPSVQASGGFDADFLVNKGTRWAKEWLRRRLEGYDSVFPINEVTEEDPSALVVRLFREKGTGDPGCQILASALGELLEECQLQAPDVPAYFTELMNLCEDQYLPGLRDWFTQRLAQAARDPNSFERTWGGTPGVKQLLFAARTQARAKPGTPAYDHWKRLLQNPFYGTIALYALAESPLLRLQHLKEWWEACPADHRTDDLEQVLTAGWKTHGEHNLTEALASNAQKHGWSKRMRDEVQSVLKKHTVKAVLPQHATEFVESAPSRVEVVAAMNGGAQHTSFNEAPVPGYEVNAEGFITQVTAKFGRLVQWDDPAGIVNKPESAFVWDPKEPDRKDIRPSMAKNGEGFFNYIQKDESNVPAFVTSQPLQSSGAARSGRFFVTLTDLRAENQFRPWPSLMDTRYLRSLDKLPFYVLRKDTKSRFIYANECFRAELREGWKVRGRRVDRGLTDVELYGGELAVRYTRDDKTVFETETVVEKIEEHLRKQGGDLELVHVIKFPLLGLNSDVVGLECVFWFVDKREEALGALRASHNLAHEQTRKVFDDPEVGFFQSTPEGRFLSVNPALARIAGYGSTRAMIEEVHDIGTQFFAQPEQREELKRRLKTRDSDRLSYEIKCKNGCFLHVHEHVRVIRDAKEEPIFYEGTIHVDRRRNRRA